MTDKDLKPVHPGEVLLKEFLEPSSIDSKASSASLKTSC